jgi:hypothetical protein
MRTKLPQFTLAVSALILSAHFAQADDKKSESPEAKPPELKILERLIGKWDWETVSKPAEWTPKEVRSKGTLTREWVLGSRFVQEKGGDADNPSQCMFTYDAQKKAYRFWLFDSKGTTLELTGQWDDASKTFSWKGDVGNGITTSGPMRFLDDDTIEWQAIAKDKDGKVYHQMEGKLKRKK